MNATVNFLAWGAMPLGSVAGGVASSVFGLRVTLWLVGAGAFASSAWLVCAPLRRTRDPPAGDALPVNGPDSHTDGH